MRYCPATTRTTRRVVALTAAAVLPLGAVMATSATAAVNEGERPRPRDRRSTTEAPSRPTSSRSATATSAAALPATTAPRAPRSSRSTRTPCRASPRELLAGLLDAAARRQAGRLDRGRLRRRCRRSVQASPRPGGWTGSTRRPVAAQSARYTYTAHRQGRHGLRHGHRRPLDARRVPRARRAGFDAVGGTTHGGLQRARHPRRRHHRRHHLRCRQGRHGRPRAGHALRQLGLLVGRPRGPRLGDARTTDRRPRPSRT